MNIMPNKLIQRQLALQILGRAMRGPKNGGNKNNTIYITKDNKIKLKNYHLLEAKALNN